MEYQSTSKWLIEKIEKSYNGTVIDTFSTNKAFVFKVYDSSKNKNIEALSSGFLDEFTKHIYIGVKVDKPKNENYVFLIDSNNIKKKYFYQRISWKDRNHSTFPKEWRNKWLESSEWDIKK